MREDGMKSKRNYMSNLPTYRIHISSLHALGKRPRREKLNYIFIKNGILYSSLREVWKVLKQSKAKLLH